MVKSSRIQAFRAEEVDGIPLSDAQIQQPHYQPGRQPGTDRRSSGWNLTPVFHLHGERPELLAADVLQRVRRQWCAPRGCTQDRRRLRRPGIGEHIPIGIPTDEVTGRKNVENPTPPVGVHRHRRAGWNTSIENSDPIIFEQDRVESWRSDHGVEIIGPRPFGGPAGAVQRELLPSRPVDIGLGYTNRTRPTVGG